MIAMLLPSYGLVVSAAGERGHAEGCCMGCMLYGAVLLYAHTALYGAVWLYGAGGEA